MQRLTHSHAWQNSFICVTWLTHTCDMTHSYMCYDSDVTRLTHTCDMTHSYMCDMPHSYTWSFIHVTWLTHTCDMTQMRRPNVGGRTSQFHSCVCHMTHSCDMTHPRDRTHPHVTRDSFMWHDSSTCDTWLIHIWRNSLIHVVVYVCDMTHSYMWHDSDAKTQRGRPYFLVSCMCVTWLIRMCDMPHSYTWSFMCVTWLTHTCDMTQMRRPNMGGLTSQFRPRRHCSYKWYLFLRIHFEIFFGILEGWGPYFSVSSS